MGRPRVIWVLLIPLAAFCGMVILAVVGRSLFSRPPFLIILQPAGTNTTVQFIQPVGFDGKMSVSPRFAADVSISEGFQAALTSDSVSIPGAKIEHGDVTMLPGAFHIRFGGTLFQVMSHRVVVNGQDYDWLEQPVDDGSTITVTK
jgi:hypothetical protein